mmetsp:Transcript_2827/g.9158  ORF Transcript_2827/g.9158 Transcript_2827/m.9158 type:complete len:265 (+) Transcript_2827:1-795(+)
MGRAGGSSARAAASSPCLPSWGAMPVELWLDCVCRDTRPGDELLAVGDHPSMGCWRTDAAVALVTSATSFPRWSFRRPLKLADDRASQTTVWVQYKYVIRRSDGSLTWEDLGIREVPTFCPSSCSTPPTLLQPNVVPRPLNRCLAGGCHLHRPHSVVLRMDEFGRHAPVAEACWAVSPGWAPELAGGDAQLQMKVQCRGAWPGHSGTELALHIFVLPRLGRLRGCLQQLARRRPLPTTLWQLVASFLGGALMEPHGGAKGKLKA